MTEKVIVIDGGNDSTEEVKEILEEKAEQEQAQTVGELTSDVEHIEEDLEEVEEQIEEVEQQVEQVESVAESAHDRIDNLAERVADMEEKESIEEMNEPGIHEPGYEEEEPTVIENPEPTEQVQVEQPEGIGMMGLAAVALIAGLVFAGIKYFERKEQKEYGESEGN